MKRVSPRDGPVRLRARRWDAIVLGGALPGLIAATRLALDKKRVLLVEEEAAARVPPSLRDPFVIPYTNGGPIDRCLRALALPLIDRRRLHGEPVGMQVLLPGVRADLGGTAHTADELVAWGLAKPEAATHWVDAWARASDEQLAQLLETPFVRSGRGLTLGRGRGRYDAEIPHAEPGTPLAEWYATLSAGLTANGEPAAARTVGAVLQGLSFFASAAESLTGLLRQRFQALHGEIRLVSRRFSLVNVDGTAAIRPGHGAELWVARAMIVNAPVAPLRRLFREAGDSDPDFLPELRVRGRRIELCFDTERDQIPEGMARRLVDATRGPEEARVSIGWNPSRSGARAEVFAHTRVETEDAAEILQVKEQLAARVRTLLPFAGERLEAREAPDAPSWDDDSIVESAPGDAWPHEIGVRLVARPPVYWLPRGAVSALGTEGECLLGWRTGDAILADLG